MPTDLSSIQRTSSRWSGVTGDEDYLTKYELQRSRGRYLIAALAASCLACVFLSLRLASKVNTPPPIVGYAAGYYFMPKPQSLQTPAESYFPQFKDTVETLFRRTEKGSLPQVEDFLGRGVREFVDNQYTAMKGSYPAGFLQTLTVTESKMESISSSEGAKMLYRGNWTVRTIQGGTTKVIFLAATFKLGKGTDLNATGWRLEEIRPISESKFYAQERDAERAERLGINPKTQ